MTTCKCCRGTGKAIDSKSTGNDFRIRRMDAGISQAAMAKSLDISRSYMRMLETGERNWSSDMIQRYSITIERAAKAAQALREALA
jgi:transcriptional regulator with XRE-family HTH domain